MRPFSYVLLTLAALAFLSLAQAGEGQTLKPPIINPTGGAYAPNAPVTVSIRAEPGSTIIYSLDGSIPRPGKGIQVDHHLAFFDLPPGGEVRVRARAVRPGMQPGPVTEAIFTRGGK